MIVTKTQYVNAKETLEAVQHLPVEAQRAILNMLHGAIAISDMYSMNGQTQPQTPAPAHEPEAAGEMGGQSNGGRR